MASSDPVDLLTGDTSDKSSIATSSRDEQELGQASRPSQQIAPLETESKEVDEMANEDSSFYSQFQARFARGSNVHSTADDEELEKMRAFEDRLAEEEGEWRTVFFVRHGKSKWNAAQGAIFSQLVAVGKGFLEYQKHKIAEQRGLSADSSVDIMDAPLSREGIMEALRLSSYLRQHLMRQKLQNYSDLTLEFQAHVHTTLALLRPEDVGDEESKQEKTDMAVLRLKQTLKRLEQFEKEQGAIEGPQRPDMAITNPMQAMTSNYITSILNGSNVNSVIATSSLRRAISTGVIAFWDRLERNEDEQIRVLSCLQEVGLNADTKTIATKERAPTASRHERASSLLTNHGIDVQYQERLDLKLYEGDATHLPVEQRMKALSEWLFTQEKQNAIVVGHSTWFQHFFRHHLRFDCTTPFDVRQFKLRNCAVVGFRIKRVLINQSVTDEETGETTTRAEWYYRIASGSLAALDANPVEGSNQTENMSDEMVEPEQRSATQPSEGESRSGKTDNAYSYNISSGFGTFRGIVGSAVASVYQSGREYAASKGTTQTESVADPQRSP